MRIYEEDGTVYFELKQENYVLLSHPYEPCLYILLDGERIKTIHNAFDASDLPKWLADDGSILGIDGRYYNEEQLCKAFEAALEYEKDECDFSFAVKLSRLEKKSPKDFVTDGVLAYGVNVGHFDFEDEKVTVYAVSDLPHIGASDAFTLYQTSHADYLRLLKLSESNSIPEKPVPAFVVEPCRKGFLCGESAHQLRYYFRLRDANHSLVEPSTSKASLMKFCPECGKKNEGDKYCRNCGTKLMKSEV